MDHEAAWVAAARGGDRRAFGRLVEHYQRPVYNMAYRMLGRSEEAEDAAQEAFLRAFRALGAYDAGRPFSTWLLSIAAHHCIDRLRRRRQQLISLDALPAWRQPAAPLVSPEAMAGHALDAQRMQGVLDTLPDEYRLVIVMRYWHDLGYAEIAELTGESVPAIKSRLHRARRQLADTLAATPGPRAPGHRHVEAEDTAARIPTGGVSACQAMTPYAI